VSAGYYKDINWGQVAGATAAGAVAGAIFTALPAATFSGALGVGALGGGASGVVGQLVTNLFDPCARWNDHLGEAALTGAVLGAAVNGAAFGVSSVVSSYLNRSFAGLSFNNAEVWPEFTPTYSKTNQALVPYDPEFAATQMRSWLQFQARIRALPWNPFTSDQWSRLGTSPRMGDFTEIRGLSPEEALKRIPSHWNIESQAEGVGIMFSDPSPSGAHPDMFRIKLPVAKYEPEAYAPDGTAKYYIARINIKLPKGDLRADKWGYGSFDNWGNLLDPRMVSHLAKNFREHPRLYIDP
jgi:hypothetical protein